MSTQPAAWYVRGASKKPAGAYSAQQIFQAWRTGRLKAGAACWRPGMPQWLPLGQVEPFASAIAKAGASSAAVAVAAQPLPAVVPSVPAAAGPGKKGGFPAWIFWAIGGGVAVAVCAAGAACFFLLARGPAPNPVRYMPENLKLFASVDVAAVRNSKAYSDLAQALGPTIDTAEQDIKKHLGITPADISRVLYGYNFEAYMGPRGLEPGMVMVMELKTPYTPDMVPGKCKKESVGGLTIYTEPGEPALYIADKWTLIVGHANMLQYVVDRKAGPKHLPAGLEDAIKQAAAGSPTVYGASIVPESFLPELHNLPISAETMKDIETVRFSADIAGDLAANLTVTCKQAKIAETIDKVLNGLVAMAGQADRIPAEAKKIIESVKVSHSGNTVSVRVSGVDSKIVIALMLPAIQAARQAAEAQRRNTDQMPRFRRLP